MRTIDLRHGAPPLNHQMYEWYKKKDFSRHFDEIVSLDVDRRAIHTLARDGGYLERIPAKRMLQQLAHRIEMLSPGAEKVHFIFH